MSQEDIKIVLARDGTWAKEEARRRGMKRLGSKKRGGQEAASHLGNTEVEAQ